MMRLVGGLGQSVRVRVWSKHMVRGSVVMYCGLL